jgi:alpha-tubulin suppressor-like RCC1 family protein
MELLAVGLNTFGQLGIGDRVRQSPFVPTKFGVPDQLSVGTANNAAEVLRGLNVDEIEDVQCGCHVTVVLFKDGRVQMAGAIMNEVIPLVRTIHIAFPPKAVQVACGRKHVLLLFDSGCVLSWGTGYFGQLGHGDDSSVEEPTLVKALTPPALGCRVSTVCAGGNHSGVVTDNGSAFMWGLNRSGQCGTSMKADVLLVPKPVDFKKAISQNGGQAVRVTQLVCGRIHSGCVSADGRVYAWGATTMGRTGLNVSTAVKVQLCPSELPLFNSRPVKQLATGDFHMLALCADGAVYSWGYSSDGQTGQSTLIHCRTPKRMEYFDMAGVSIDSIACGSGYSMAKDAAGYLYSWGYGDGGWMGLKPPAEEDMAVFECDDAADYPIIRGHTHIRSFDSTHTVILPAKVTLLKNKIIDKMRCGGAHTIIFASPRSSTVFDKEDDRQSEQDVVHNMMMLDTESDEEELGMIRRVSSSTGRK